MSGGERPKMVVGRVVDIGTGKPAVQSPISRPTPGPISKEAAIAAIGLAFTEAWKVRTAGGRPIPETIYHELLGRGIDLVNRG